LQNTDHLHTLKTFDSLFGNKLSKYAFEELDKVGIGIGDLRTKVKVGGQVEKYLDSICGTLAPTPRGQLTPFLPTLPYRHFPYITIPFCFLSPIKEFKMRKLRSFFYFFYFFFILEEGLFCLSLLTVGSLVSSVAPSLKLMCALIHPFSLQTIPSTLPKLSQKLVFFSSHWCIH
jgi:hypothetical protein